ncbi:wiskott-Aldrich syndrome protein family member 2-like isoform X3 [Penaeus japonicus]|uniref:wiskott-Aldrich syndrome protein family member 2-like isoform X3 n=2 Tax=Penaeus TaxID=133894 RepID=UPI001C70F4A0|nr:wiskott-Aldrich syndrome protein family member 2-like isoform X3 [Penaeus japonicus]
MPLLKRVVSPVHVSRVPLVEEWVTDDNGRVYAALLPATNQPQDLESFTNLTLANLITQLSSLSRHAEDLFGEMITESTSILNRTVSLQGRVDKLSVKVKNLDSNVEEVSLQDIHMRKAFKSSALFDQQVVSRDTIPAAMLETYETCEQPPPLHQLNPYRDDGKDGLKFYTDPSYFFNLWREEMTQETERLKLDKKQKHAHGGEHRNEPNKPKGDGRNKSKKIPRQAGNTREKHRQLAIAHGEYIAPQSQYRTPMNQVNENMYDQSLGMSTADGRPLRPNSIELRGHYVNAQTGQEVVYGTNSHPQAYSPTQEMAQTVPASDHSGYPPPYQDQYSGYPPPPYTPDGAGSQGSTPSRSSSQRPPSNRPLQPPPAPPSGNNTPTPPGGSHSGTPTRLRGPSQGRECLPPPPPPPGPQQVSHPGLSRGPSMSPGPGRHVQPHEHDLPPPPPTPDKAGDAEPPPPSPPPPPPIPAIQEGGPPPPPPPPPPVPNGNAPGAPLPPPMPNGVIKQQPQTVLAKPKKVEKKVLPPVETDGRSDLLKAIREGIKLRKVDDVKTKPKEDPDSVDVASILQRRFAFEVSDSESSSDSESDSDEWDETSA